MTGQANAQKISPNQKQGKTKRQADICRCKTSGNRCAEDCVESTLSQDLYATGVRIFAFHTILPALNQLFLTAFGYISALDPLARDPLDTVIATSGFYAAPETGYITWKHCRDFQVVGAARALPTPPNLYAHLPPPSPFCPCLKPPQRYSLKPGRYC